jgi:hypothetical protein
MIQKVQKCNQFFVRTVQRLPDGRRLVSEFDQPTKVVDTYGNEIIPAASELVALKAITKMVFPRRARRMEELMECA